MTKRQPNEQREQKPNLFGLCQVASEEEVFNPQLLTLLTVGIYRTYLKYLCDVFRRIKNTPDGKLVGLLAHKWQPATVSEWV